MFEAGMVTSRNIVSTKTRWTILVSLAVQGILLAILIMIPLLHPEILHLGAVTPLPAPVFTPPPHITPVAAATSSTAAPSTPSPIQLANNTQPRLPSPFAQITADAPTINFTGMQTMSTGIPNGLGGGCTSNCGTVSGPEEKRRGPIRISQGVMEGRLLHPIQPTYPAIAKATRTTGEVVIQATIATDGTVKNVQVVRGPAMLVQAALDAVRQARYQPYKLGSEPVEVETTIVIDFTMN
jgi:protein TonB